MFGAEPDAPVKLVGEPGDATDFADEDGVDVVSDSRTEPVALLAAVTSGAGDDGDALAGVARGVPVGDALAQLVGTRA